MCDSSFSLSELTACLVAVVDAEEHVPAQRHRLHHRQLQVHHNAVGAAEPAHLAP